MSKDLISNPPESDRKVVPIEEYEALQAEVEHLRALTAALMEENAVLNGQVTLH